MTVERGFLNEIKDQRLPVNGKDGLERNKGESQKMREDAPVGKLLALEFKG